MRHRPSTNRPATTAGSDADRAGRGELFEKRSALTPDAVRLVSLEECRGSLATSRKRLIMDHRMAEPFSGRKAWVYLAMKTTPIETSGGTPFLSLCRDGRGSVSFTPVRFIHGDEHPDPMEALRAHVALGEHLSTMTATDKEGPHE